MEKITPEELAEKNDRDLAVYGERHSPQSAEGILIEKEWQRRLMKTQQEFNKTLMLEQHELNLQIVKRQSRLTKIAIAAAFIGVIVGSILTSYLSKCLLSDKPTIQKLSLQQSLQPINNNMTSK